MGESDDRTASTCSEILSAHSCPEAHTLQRNPNRISVCHVVRSNIEAVKVQSTRTFKAVEKRNRELT